MHTQLWETIIKPYSLPSGTWKYHGLSAMRPERQQQQKISVTCVTLQAALLIQVCIDNSHLFNCSLQLVIHTFFAADHQDTLFDGPVYIIWMVGRVRTPELTRLPFVTRHGWIVYVPVGTVGFLQYYTPRFKQEQQRQVKCLHKGSTGMILVGPFDSKFDAFSTPSPCGECRFKSRLLLSTQLSVFFQF